MEAECGGEFAVRPFEALLILPDVKATHNINFRLYTIFFFSLSDLKDTCIKQS